MKEEEENVRKEWKRKRERTLRHRKPSAYYSMRREVRRERERDREKRENKKEKVYDRNEISFYIKRASLKMYKIYLYMFLNSYYLSLVKK